MAHHPVDAHKIETREALAWAGKAELPQVLPVGCVNQLLMR